MNRRFGFVNSEPTFLTWSGRLGMALLWIAIGCGWFRVNAETQDKDQLIMQLKKRITQLEKEKNNEKILDFRAMCTVVGRGQRDWGGRCAFNFSDTDGAEKYIKQWSSEGFNAVVWWIADSELMGGSHWILQLKEFPEAREISDKQVQANRAWVKWLLGKSKQAGMENYFYTGSINFTDAFAKAHGLDKKMEVSETVHTTHNHILTCGVRNDLTRAYTTALFKEMAQTYSDLDGFYSAMGESLPGKRSSWFGEAIAPGLKQAGRPLRAMIHNWQIPLEQYIEDIASRKYYENVWCVLHAWNSEQITDAEPYPFVSMWARETALPTVATLSPANVTNFPFNSPRFAYEIVHQMRRIENFRGFAYMEWSGPKLSPLFRKSLAYYAQTGEDYDAERWIKLLEEQFSDRTAAEHFLKAFDLSGRIIPETCALVWCGHNNYPFRRELRIPYHFLKDDWQPFSWQTSRVRGKPLQPVWNYARWVARNPEQYKNNNGSSVTRHNEKAYDNYRQIAIWRTEGGSVYDVIPPVHMANIRKMGQDCAHEAETAFKTVQKNKQEAERIVKFMKGYELLSVYYEKKVLAAIAAMIYADRHGKADNSPKEAGMGGRHPITADSHRAADKLEAERLADEAVTAFVAAAKYMDVNLTPIMQELYERVIREMGGPDLEQLIKDEKEERKDMPKLFGWPD